MKYSGVFVTGFGDCIWDSLGLLVTAYTGCPTGGEIINKGQGSSDYVEASNRLESPKIF